MRVHPFVRSPGCRLHFVCCAVAQPAVARGAPDSFADLADKLLPTVVNIATTQTLKPPPVRRPALPNMPPGSPLADLFKDFLAQQQSRAAPRHVARHPASSSIRRLDRHQQPRDRRCRPDHRHAERRHDRFPPSSSAATRRPISRLLKVKPKKPLPATQVRRFRSCPRRRLGDRDRQSLRSRQHGDGRHRLGAQPRYQCRAL